MKDRMFRNGGIKEDLMKTRFHPKTCINSTRWVLVLMMILNTILAKNG
jgi:hypothetical protein